MATVNVGAVGLHGTPEAQPSKDELLRKARFELLAIAEENPSHYRWLGLPEFESDPNVINVASEQRLNYLQSKRLNKKHGVLVDELLNIVTRSTRVLLDEQKKQEYDKILAAKLAPQAAAGVTRKSVSEVVPTVVTDAPQPVQLHIAPSTRPREASPSAFVAGVQKYWKQLAVGVAALGISTGSVMYVTSGSNGEAKDTAPAKAPKEPGNDAPVLTKVAADTSANVREVFPTATADTPPIAASQPETSAFPPAEPAFPPAFTAAVPPTETPVTQTPVAQPIPVPERATEKPVTETLVAEATGKQPATPAFDKEEYALNRKMLLDAVKGKKGVEQIDELINTYGNNEEIMKDNEMAKAVLVEAFMLSSKAGDLQRSYQTALRMFSRAHLFEKTEIDYATGRLKELAATSTDRMTAFSTYELLLTKGAMNRADALNSKLAHYKKGKDTVEGAQEILTQARAWANEEPEIAEQYAREARASFPLTRDTKPQKEAFDKEVAQTLKTIVQAKEFKKANELLALDPTNAEARRVRGEIHMERGNTVDALIDLKDSNHPTLSSLAGETNALLAQGKSAAGEMLLAAAQKWKTEADDPKANGKRAAFNRIEKGLLESAIATTNQPLHPLMKPPVLKRLKELGVDSTPATVVTTTPPRTPQTTPNDVSKEPVWIKGIDRIDTAKGVGKWVRDQKTGQLTLTEKGGNDLVPYPWTLPADNFDVTIRVKFDNYQGSHGIITTLPIGRGVTLVVRPDGAKGAIAVLSNIQGAPVEKVLPGYIIGTDEHTWTIRLQSKNGKASIDVDDGSTEIINTSFELGTVTPRKGWEGNGFGTHYSTMNLKEMDVMETAPVQTSRIQRR